MRIYFAPKIPLTQDYSIVAMIHYLGYSVARSPEEPFDFGYLWEDRTYVKPSAELRAIAEKKPVLNIRCTDISKVKVDRVGQGILGYGSLVDPRTFDGKVIRKFDENGKGGGEIIDCPDQTPRTPDGSIFQRFIETNPGGPQLEYRVPYVLGAIPAVFEVYKDDPDAVKGRHIKNQYKRSIVLKTADEIFSGREQEQIVRFCEGMGFDIGELDVLRCAESGRMYLIDANTTPTYFNMFNRYWKPAEKRKAIALVAEAWERRLQALIHPA